MSRGAPPRPVDEARAIVLARADYRERDLIVRCAIEDRGLVPLVARGARGSHKRYGGALDDLAAVQLRYSAPDHGLGSVREAQRLAGPAPDPGDVAAFAVRAYAAELLCVVVEEGHPSRFPFKLSAWLHEVFAAPADRAARGPRAAWALARAQVIVLHREGRLPDLWACSACGAPLAAGAPVHLTAEQGLRCPTCGAGRHDAAPAPFEDLACLRGLYSGEAGPEAVASALLRRWLFARLAEVAPRPLRSAAFLRDVGLA